MTTHSHQMTDIEQIKTFVRGGKARFTLVSKATQARFTYRVRASDDGKVFFVKTLTGPDNTNSYTFLGTIFSDGTYRHGSRSAISATAPSAVAFEWFFRAVARGDIDRVEFWHEGRCGRCGRVLTVPGSIETGFGPECAGILGIEPPTRATTLTEDLAPAGEDYRNLSIAAGGDPMDEFIPDIQRREAEEEERRMAFKFGREA